MARKKLVNQTIFLHVPIKLKKVSTLVVHQQKRNCFLNIILNMMFSKNTNKLSCNNLIITI